MPGVVENLPHGTRLDDPAQVHNGDVVAGFGNDTQIVGDEQHGHLMFGLQFPDQLQDLGPAR